MFTRSHATTMDRPALAEIGGMGVDELIVRFIRTREMGEMAAIANALGGSGDRRAVRPLLMRLKDCQGWAEAETAVCGALVRLDVMCRCGACAFCLRPRPALPDEVADTIHELAGTIPWPYFGHRQI